MTISRYQIKHALNDVCGEAIHTFEVQPYTINLSKHSP